MKQKILNDYNNNRTQWMLEHDCKNDKDVLFKMMQIYADHINDTYIAANEKI